MSYSPITLESIDTKITQIEESLRTKYATIATMNNIIGTKISISEDLLARITHIEEQYGIIVGTDHKLLTNEEYTALMSLYHDVGALITDLNIIVNRINSDNLTFTEKITSTFATYKLTVSTMQTEIDNLTASVAALSAQLSELNSMYTELLTRVTG